MKKRILVVEDDVPLAEGLRMNLELEGYEPIVCRSAEHAEVGDVALQLLGIVVVVERDDVAVAVDDLVAILDAGAYGAVMASNYNRRPMAAEVLVESSGWRRIRRRQTIEDLLRWDE